MRGEWKSQQRSTNIAHIAAHCQWDQWNIGSSRSTKVGGMLLISCGNSLPNEGPLYHRNPSPSCNVFLSTFVHGTETVQPHLVLLEKWSYVDYLVLQWEIALNLSEIQMDGWEIHSSTKTHPSQIWRRCFFNMEKCLFLEPENGPELSYWDPIEMHCPFSTYPLHPWWMILHSRHKSQAIPFHCILGPNK